jgi:hypothetical protein
MEQRVNVRFRVKLHKSPTGQTLVNRVGIEEFLHAKDATDVKVQDQNNVGLLLRHRGIVHLNLYPKGPMLIRHYTWRQNPVSEMLF